MNKRANRIFIVLLILLIVTVIAFFYWRKQLNGGEANTNQKDSVVYHETTIYDFDEDTVEGDLLKPEATEPVSSSTPEKSKPSKAVRNKEDSIHAADPKLRDTEKSKSK